MTDSAGWRSYFVPEPLLTFGHRQVATNPKDGLFLFGPVNDRQSPLHMRVGVIGTEAGIRRYSRWVKKISRPIAAPEVANPANTYMWPGFEAVFGAVWDPEPFASCHVDADELSRLIRIGNRSEAIYSAVELYETALRKYLREQEAAPDMWFVVVPEEIHRYGRPQSSVPKAEREEGTWPITKAQAKRLNPMPLFGADEADEAAQKYDYVSNFHHQLKARIIDTGAVVQIARESTLAPDEAMEMRRSLQDPATTAWNLATTAFYKAGGKPWKLAQVRPGVCYVGLVFKKLDRVSGPDNACCGAQMFLSSGEGVVFRGAVGPWYSEDLGGFHLTREQARTLLSMAVESYRDIHAEDPSEIFIHGRIRYDNDEWAGFSDSVPPCGVADGDGRAVPAKPD